MRIIDTQEFYLLPENVVFSYYKPCIISGLFIKGRTIKDLFDNVPIDYIEISLLDNIGCQDSGEYLNILLEEKEFKIDYESGSRNGMYNKDQQYILYSNEDIERLIHVLQSCLNTNLILNEALK